MLKWPNIDHFLSKVNPFYKRLFMRFLIERGIIDEFDYELNCHRINETYTSTTLEFIINESFTWGATKQGYKYWFENSSTWAQYWRRHAYFHPDLI